MYSLDINFLKDRPDYQPKSARGVRRPTISTPSGAFTPLYIGVAIGLFLPALVGGLWFFVQQQNASLEQKQAQLDAELGKLTAFDQQIAALNAQTSAIKAETTALGNVFNRIRPWSAILQDIRDRIPGGVQVKTIKQTAQVLAPAPTATPTPAPNATPTPVVTIPIDKLSIVGTANSFDNVNDFMLLLQQSSFVKAKETQLIKANLVDNPLPVEVAKQNSVGSKVYKLPQVVEYEIQTTLNDVPSAVLVQELERKGAVGLASRIRNLQSKGVIQP
ncbi:PilN domain-containing protein [Merismopedia glauca]|uniref:Fimbrial assembly protein n=1 Tax=Merismopedia glauca CCAP 1448/3 TaxID=1296344 RepID=A0A2T1BXE1_9CYAN|nr:PilN domain-containing protein [Merismopedia glauca]PSB00662.1 fimbrial assembly protein [Merismopedia glauca CCAP 1448/3]